MKEKKNLKNCPMKKKIEIEIEMSPEQEALLNLINDRCKQDGAFEQEYDVLNPDLGYLCITGLVEQIEDELYCITTLGEKFI